VKEVRGLTVHAVVVGVSVSEHGGGGNVVVDARGWLQADVTSLSLLCLCAAGRHHCMSGGGHGVGGQVCRASLLWLLLTLSCHWPVVVVIIVVAIVVVVFPAR